MLIGSAPVFCVSDMVAATAFYRDGLGFEVSFAYGEPVLYAGLCRDQVALHLTTTARSGRSPGQSAICVFVKDVDAVCTEVVGRGVQPFKLPYDYDYGMREFEVRDADGNRIFFSMPTAKEG